MRGKHLLKRRGVLPMRITPACAGKTRRIVQIFHTMKDHPRVCGENVKIGHPWKVSEGSPPRVRGKRIGAFSLRITEGITPACAGKTLLGPHLVELPEDHPRVCGENLGVQFNQSGVWGSPPRVRGKRRWRETPLPGSRITPACAGKTTGKAGNHTPSQDHPRVCGENVTAIGVSRRG